MNTYYVKLVAGTWLAKTVTGEAVFSAENREAAVELAHAMQKANDSKWFSATEAAPARCTPITAASNRSPGC